MIPTGGNRNDEFLQETVQTSRTWKLDVQQKRITGMIDQIDAVKQAVYKVLQTERFRYLIYSFNYGIETHGLIGQSPTYVRTELRRRIQEALLQDDRIQRVEDVTVEHHADQLLITFTVVSDYGTFQMEEEVNPLV